MDPNLVPNIEIVEIAQIRIANSRVRSPKGFREIVESIRSIGLKRPITVCRRKGGADTEFDLVCGQGRLEAFQLLDQTEIPALVIEASEEDCMVMSLVENLARRRHNPVELLHDIRRLKEGGTSESNIAKLTGLSHRYVSFVTRLLGKGEERLLAAVERGHLPFHLALAIADAKNEEIQELLQQAYEKNELRGNQLVAIKQMIRLRQVSGRSLRGQIRTRTAQPRSTAALVRMYKQEADKLRSLLRKAEHAQRQLLFVVNALGALRNDENFVTLLRAESLEDMPVMLMELIEGSQGLISDG
jgi:ParB family chromosome partitioning protein